jgi:xanthine dehydrogenase iron-sulfur cluster and FAD-binding subunit A
LYNSWLDRDLGVACRVCRVDSSPAGKLLRLEENPLHIPQLAIHLDRMVNEQGLVLNAQKHLVPVLGQHEGPSLESWIEAEAGALHPMQEAFREHHGLQCGFCTPGMVMSAVDLCARKADPSEREIREWLEGNICRCTGYHNIVKAVQAGAKALGGRS